MARFRIGITVFLGLLASANIYAVPSMGRQTGMQCSSCHTVFPELTPFGRQFKLRGFSQKAPNVKFPASLPISALLQVSWVSTQKTKNTDPENFPHNDEVIPQAVGLYYGGKITKKSGALIQASYDGIEDKVVVEMFDARYADSLSFADNQEMVYGLTLNNNPTLSDIYNSTPQWSFPHAETAALSPAARTQIDTTLASQVGGLGVYTLWDNLVYGEVAFYRSARRGLLRPLGAGVPTENVVNDFAPYWRVALQHEWGSHSLAAGTYGMVADVFPDPDNTGGPADRFTDVALDAQYQYIGGEHIVSTAATWIREAQDWNASFAQGFTSNKSDVLQTFRIDAHYYYQRLFGGGIQFFSTWGNSNALKYNTGEPVTGSANGKPNSNGLIAELNYLPLSNVKLAARYTAYGQFNGASHNYDGFGRNASDNNSIFLLAWLLF
ncbi:hypothetical protein [Methylosarcina fibrata]|uniref:hypothetical protein n=1 Tax=Methylosarcina fibrata TaxID=105972 RepID=UPI0003AA2A52|nr:hypothetical protein [Methylosarcina fibrata]